jgi:hypothetical protein
MLREEAMLTILKKCSFCGSRSKRRQSLNFAKLEGYLCRDCGAFTGDDGATWDRMSLLAATLQADPHSLAAVDFAVMLLEEFGPADAERAAPALIKAIEENLPGEGRWNPLDGRNCAVLCTALGRLGPAAKDGVEALLRVMEEANWQNRESCPLKRAALAIGKIAPEELKRLESHASPRVRDHAAVTSQMLAAGRV